jgi:voltage-gated sodium channel
MIKKVDADGSGALNFNEFVFVMSDGRLDLVAERKAKVVRKESLSEAAALGAREAAEAAEERQERLTQELQRAWGLDYEERRVRAAHLDGKPLLAWYMGYADWCHWLEEDYYFNAFMTAVIVGAGTLVGIQTELAVPGKGARQSFPVLDGFEVVILIVFTFEVAVKLVARGERPLDFFSDNWNRMDFVIVALCDIFAIPGMPSVGSILSMLRLVRLLRILKLIKAIPELRVIIEALIGGFSQFVFVLLILIIVYYVYANIGVLLFSQNDVGHFGNLHVTLWSLFRMATFDAWSDLLYTEMVGCNNFYIYSLGRKEHGFDITARKKKDLANCNHPYGSGWIAFFYCVSFCMFGSQVLLSLFIGVVSNAMDEAKEAFDKEKVVEERLRERIKQLGIENGPMIESYRKIFALLDDSGGDCMKLSRESVKAILPVLPSVHQSFLDLVKDSDQHPLSLLRLDIERLFDILALGDAHFAESVLTFIEFCSVSTRL